MSAGFRSRWLDWTPEETPGHLEAPPPCEPTKPRSVGPLGSRPPRVSRIPVPSEAPAPPVCFSCWGSDFWQGSGAVVCRRCHPPAPGAEVLS